MWIIAGYFLREKTDSTEWKYFFFLCETYITRKNKQTANSHLLVFVKRPLVFDVFSPWQMLIGCKIST